MAPRRDKEMGVFTGLGIAVAIVLVTVIGYFAYQWYEQKQLGTAPPPVMGSSQGRGQWPAASHGVDSPGIPATRPPASGPLSHNNLVFGGLPKAPAGYPVNILENKGYISGYSESRRDPLFVAYSVFDAGTVTVGKRPAKFKLDLRSTSGVDHDDYTGSGYDRGHMAPNHIIAKCYGQEAQEETFFVTNICPQTATLNQKVWESLEHLEGDVYPTEFGNVWVVDGPIFDQNPRTIGVHKVQVPVAFYKILIENHTGVTRTMQVIMPQNVAAEDRNHLDKFLVTVREIEAQTGLTFFPDLPQDEQNRIETQKPEMWPLPR